MDVIGQMLRDDHKARRSLLEEIHVEGLTKLIPMGSEEIGIEGNIWLPSRVVLPQGTPPEIIQISEPSTLIIPYLTDKKKIVEEYSKLIENVANRTKEISSALKSYFEPNAFSLSGLEPFIKRVHPLSEDTREYLQTKLTLYQIK